MKARLLVKKHYSANWVMAFPPIPAGTVVPVVEATNIPQEGDAIRFWIATPELANDPYGVGLYDGEFELLVDDDFEDDEDFENDFEPDMCDFTEAP